jgi:uncharacterized protein
MKVSIFCAPADEGACDALLDSFRDAGMDASIFAVKDGWQDMSFPQLLDAVGQSTHFLLVWSALSRDASWLPFAVGWAFGNGYHTALYRLGTDPAIAGYLSHLPVLGSPEELSNYYVIERSLFLEERERSQARRELYDSGLSYTVEGMADCVREGNLGAVELFLQSGLSAEVRDKHGVPLLCLAARGKHRRMASLLVERGVNVNAQSEDRGSTALMDAASSGATEIVADLLASGAKPDMVSKDGQTALIMAVGRGDDAVAAILLKAGADPDVADKLGFSARKYATLFHNPKVSELFETPRAGPDR